MPVSLEPVDFTRLAPAPGTRMVVVGGCGGIGRRLVEIGAGLGLRLAVVDLPKSLADHPPPDGVAAYQADVRDEAQVARAFAGLDAEWGGLDVLVHLPGYTLPPTPLEEISEAEWEDVLSVNLKSAFLAARHGLPLLRRAGKASIVTAASGLAVHVEPGVAPYAASKAGLIALTKALAKENAPAIRANVVAPGAVDTAFSRGGTGREPIEDWFHSRAMGDDILKTIPLGRIAVPDDVVGPILFLAGDASRFMTGQVLYINGGRLMP